MVKYLDYVLKVFGGPGLSKLHSCGATELPNLPNYFESALWTYIAGLIPNLSVFHIELTFLRRAGRPQRNMKPVENFYCFTLQAFKKENIAFLPTIPKFPQRSSLKPTSWSNEANRSSAPERT
jgi:hypothetical protein